MQATMGKAGYVSVPTPIRPLSVTHTPVSPTRVSYPLCISALTRFLLVSA